MSNLNPIYEMNSSAAICGGVSALSAASTVLGMRIVRLLRKTEKAISIATNRSEMVNLITQMVDKMFIIKSKPDIKELIESGKIPARFFPNVAENYASIINTVDDKEKLRLALIHKIEADIGEFSMITGITGLYTVGGAAVSILAYKTGK